MRYGSIKTNDVANGEGVRVTVFVSGCDKRCKGCHNPEAWSFGYGEPFTLSDFVLVMEELSKPHVQGLTLCGGEPLHDRNWEASLELARWAHRLGKDVWCYTGYRFEEIPRNRLEHIDVLVDGEYIESCKDPSLWFRGSSNQRIIDVAKTLEKGKVVLWKSS